MNEEKQNSDDQSQESEEKKPLDREFEITSDLNIAPVNNPDQVLPTKPDIISEQEKPHTGLQDEIGKMNIEAAIYRATKKSNPIQRATPVADIEGVHNLNEIKKPIDTVQPPIQSPTNIASTSGYKQSSMASQPLKSSQTPISISADGRLQNDKAEPVEKPTHPLAQKPIRTYESDVAEFMAHRNTSMSTMVMAEKEKSKERVEYGEGSMENGGKEIKSHSALKLTLIFLSLIFIGVGLVGAYYFYSHSPLAPQTSVIPTDQESVASLVPSDNIAVILVDGLNRNQIISKVRDEIAGSQPADTIKEIVLAKTRQTSSGQQMVRTSGQEMLATMDVGAPDIISRTITNDWMLGVYAGQSGQKYAFVIATTNYFQNAFAGMLAWEYVMADDLRQFLEPNSVMGIANIVPEKVTEDQILQDVDVVLPKTSTTTTGTTTDDIVASTTIANTTATTTNIVQELIAPYFTLSGRFYDAIVDNKDVREFRTDDNKVLFLYSFIDNQKIVVTSSGRVLSEIISRLEKQALVR